MNWTNKERDRTWKQAIAACAELVDSINGWNELYRSAFICFKIDWFSRLLYANNAKANNARSFKSGSVICINWKTTFSTLNSFAKRFWFSGLFNTNFDKVKQHST